MNFIVLAMGPNILEIGQLSRTVRDILHHFSTIDPILRQLVSPDAVTQMLCGTGVLHLPDVLPQEVLLDVVVVVNDSHALHVAGQVADLLGPQFLQLRGADPISIGGPLLATMGIKSVETSKEWILCLNSILHSNEWIGVPLNLNCGLLKLTNLESLSWWSLDSSQSHVLVYWSLETLLHQFILVLHEVCNIALSPTF